MRHDLRISPIFTIMRAGERETHSLSSVLALLSLGEKIEFSYLQPHQQHPWYAFLVQLAAMGMRVVNTAKLLTSPKQWAETLLVLTGRQQEPWCLVVEDLSLPAFLQPPVPEKDLTTWKKPLRTPGEVDVLITAKNFDVKIKRCSASRPEHWVYSLLTKQTAEGVLGLGNYGIARMNGGTSSRPCVAITPSLDWSVRFQRDVDLWMEHHDAIRKEHGYGGKVGLVWLVPWDGTTKIPRKDLHPFFIEICRRIRLVEVGGELAARTTPTKGTRIFNEGHGGHTGDLWTPIYLKKGVKTSLSLDEGGFHFRRLQDILFQWEASPALTPIAEDSWLYAASLCRAQGKTLGFHERAVKIPAEIGRLLLSPLARKRLAACAQARVDRFSAVAHGLLKPVLLALLQGVQDGRVNMRDTRVLPWIERFEALVDERFFPSLWGAGELSEEESLKVWDLELVSLLEPFLEQARQEVPISLALRKALLESSQARYLAGKIKLFGVGA